MRRLYPTNKSMKKSVLDIETKEEQAINDLFVDETEEEEEEHYVSLPLSTDREEDATSYEATVYDFLSEEETGELWAAKSEKYARIIREHLVSALSFLDASKSVEEHFQREMHTSLALIDNDFLKSITYLLQLKLFTEVASEMDFKPEEAEIIFFKEVESIKGKGPIKNLVQFLKNTGAEDNPYGDTTPIGMTRKRRDNDR